MIPSPMPLPLTMSWERQRPIRVGLPMSALVEKQFSEFTPLRHSVHDIAHDFQTSFEETWKTWPGSEVIRFTANPFLTEGNPCYDKFKRGIQKMEQHPAFYQLMLVFHGTNKANLNSILRDGLDPSLRKRQSHGKGEYFAKTPNIALTYCRSESREEYSEMVVFVVALNYSGTGSIVVVPDNSMQLPIGIFQFALINSFEVSLNKQRKEIMDKRFHNISKHLKGLEPKDLRDRLKTLILRDLDRKELVLAGDLYARYKDVLEGTEEESMILNYIRYREVDSFDVQRYFPGLPGKLHGSSISL